MNISALGIEVSQRLLGILFWHSALGIALWQNALDIAHTNFLYQNMLIFYALLIKYAVYDRLHLS